ncbi:MAG: DUF551 domain-containing protein [Candidatus Anammoxibacter sp.]
MIEWISIEDSLPNSSGDYLAFSKSTGVAWMIFSDLQGFVSGDEYILDVTHWMLLPEPPK